MIQLDSYQDVINFIEKETAPLVLADKEVEHIKQELLPHHELRGLLAAFNYEYIRCESYVNKLRNKLAEDPEANLSIQKEIIEEEETIALMDKIMTTAAKAIKERNQISEFYLNNQAADKDDIAAEAAQFAEHYEIFIQKKTEVEEALTQPEHHTAARLFCKIPRYSWKDRFVRKTDKGYKPTCLGCRELAVRANEIEKWNTLMTESKISKNVYARPKKKSPAKICRRFERT